MKKILCLVILLTMSISSINIYATKEQVAAFIPVKMQPNSTITYNDDLTYEIEIASVKPVTIKHTVEDEERKAEEEFIRQIKNEDKDLPHYKLITVLPKPFPGMRVIYGSDGGINHILNVDGTEVLTESYSMEYTNQRRAIDLRIYATESEATNIGGTDNSSTIFDGGKKGYVYLHNNDFEYGMSPTVNIALKLSKGGDESKGE